MDALINKSRIFSAAKYEVHVPPPTCLFLIKLYLLQTICFPSEHVYLGHTSTGQHFLNLSAFCRLKLV